MTESFAVIFLSDPHEREEYETGYRDGLAKAPWPELFPPPAYFAGREAAQKELRDAA